MHLFEHDSTWASSTRQAGDDCRDHRRDRGQSNVRTRYLLYVNEMAAASGELELRASLIAHVLALGGLNVSQRWRAEVSCRFHMAQRPALVFSNVLGIATCASAGEVVRAGSLVIQPCHSVAHLSPTVSSPNGVHAQAKKQRAKVQTPNRVWQDRNERRPPQQIDCANRNQSMMGWA